MAAAEGPIMDTSIAKARDAQTSPLCRAVLDYSLIFKRVLDRAKTAKLTPADWAPLENLIAVDEFERIGVYKEVYNWPQYREFLTEFATAAEWEGTFKRISEVPNLVFLELEERTRMGDM